MGTSVVLGLLTGAGFGAVLYKVGATRYSRVMGMLTLRDTKIMKFAFTAIAAASVLYGLAAASGLAESWNLVPRVMPYLGRAHVLGGIVFGLAMGVTGNCPGTCVAKAGGRGGAHRFAPTASVIGLVLGIFAYSALKPWLMDTTIIDPNQKPMTLHGLLGLPYAAAALIFGAVMLAITFAADRLTPERYYPPAREKRTVLDHVRGEWSWLAGGVVGGVLVVLATAQHGYLGFSGAVLAAVGWAMHAVGAPLDVVPTITPEIAWRAALIVGVFPGAMLARAVSLPSADAVATGPVKPVVSWKAIGTSGTAGFGLSLGAMIGGGCTTGAFIAAWPTLSVASFTMGGTFFVVSMATAAARSALHRYDLRQLQASGAAVYD